MPDPLDVPVAGGTLRVASWPGTGVPVLAIHGITSSSRTWPFLAESVDNPVFAPDLRGRGRSNHLPGPVGIAQHAEDRRCRGSRPMWPPCGRTWRKRWKSRWSR